MWKDFHEFWLKAKIPVYIVRFEDILMNPKTTLLGLLEYILNSETSLAGTNVERLIDLCLLDKPP